MLELLAEISIEIFFYIGYVIDHTYIRLFNNNNDDDDRWS